jgi:two-component system, cell cycle response regulator
MNKSTDPYIVLDQIDDLPSLTPIVSSILGLIESRDSQAKQIADLIQNDTALSSKILRVVNSAFYGLKSKVSTVQNAVVLLGYETIKTIVLSASVFEILLKNSDPIADLNIIWERSLFAAVTSRKLSRRIGYDNPEECFMSALVMDIGMLVQLKLHKEEYPKVIYSEIHKGEDIVTAEVDSFAISHERLGHALMQKWELPDVLSKPVLYHHDISEVDKEDSRIQKICRITHLVRLATNIFFGKKKGRALHDYKVESERLIKMGPDEVDIVFRSIREEVIEVARQYGFNMKPLQSYTEILDAANKELTEQNRTYEEMNRELLAANKKAETLAKRLRKANEKLELVASVDELTGLYNRHYFETHFQRELTRCIRYKRPMSVMILDIDFFKKFNDTYGHLQGDSILQELGGRLRNLIRGSDTAVRFGGEEFVILLPETALYSARIAAEKVRRAIERDKFKYKPGNSLQVTISIGIAAFDGNEKQLSTKELLKKADDKLYEAKESGRNKCCH